MLRNTPFSWSDSGEGIVYMDFDVLSVTKDGTVLSEFDFESNGEIITSVDFLSLQGGRLIITTEMPTYNLSKLFLYEISKT